MLLNIDVAANRLQIKNHGCSPHPEFIFPSQDQKHQLSTEAVSCAETKREMKVIVFTLKTGQISLRWFLFGRMPLFFLIISIQESCFQRALF